MLLQFLIIFMVLDYVTGFGAAIRHKRVNSEIMYWGGFRKAAILIVIALATMFDSLASQDVPVFRTMAIYFYLSREGVSVVENLGQLGVPLPSFLSKFLEQLRDRGGDSDEQGTK
jgi:toxin secretion/phage lysis holin